MNLHALTICQAWDISGMVCGKTVVCSVTMLRFHKKIWDWQVDWLWQFEQLRAEGALVPRMHAELEAFCCHQISALLELMEGWDGEVSVESTHGSALSKLWTSLNLAGSTKGSLLISYVLLSAWLLTPFVGAGFGGIWTELAVATSVCVHYCQIFLTNVVLTPANSLAHFLLLLWGTEVQGDFTCWCQLGGL